jgi:Ca2+-binding RTX toxin-like protein
VDLIVASWALLFAGTLALQLGVLDGGDDEGGAETADPGDQLAETTEIPPEAAPEALPVRRGGAGDDRLEGETAATAWFPEAGNDTVDGSAGDDWADGGTGDDLLLMRNGEDVARGGAGADTLDGGLGRDALLGEGGADQLLGGSGTDTLRGGEDDDTVLGGSDPDFLFGDAGDDYLSGFAFDDSQSDAQATADGVDVLEGGAGNDTLLLAPGDSGAGGAGEDRFQLDQRDGPGALQARVTDYAPGDRIELFYRPALDASGAEVPPQVELRANAAGTAGILRLNGVDVATVDGGQALTLADIVLRRV